MKPVLTQRVEWRVANEIQSEVMPSRAAARREAKRINAHPVFRRVRAVRVLVIEVWNDA